MKWSKTQYSEEIPARVNTYEKLVLEFEREEIRDLLRIAAGFETAGDSRGRLASQIADACRARVVSDAT